MGVQEELDELKQEKRELKRQIQLADGIIKEDLYTAYYAVSEDEEIVGDKEIEIPGMEQHEDVVEVKKKGTTDIDDVDTKICRKEDAFSVYLLLSVLNLLDLFFLLTYEIHKLHNTFDVIIHKQQIFIL